MKKAYSRLLCLRLAAVLAAVAAGCAPAQIPESTGTPAEKPDYIPDTKVEGCGVYVKKIDNLPEDFIFGLDASSGLAEEASGVKY